MFPTLSLFLLCLSRQSGNCNGLWVKNVIIQICRIFFSSLNLPEKFPLTIKTRSHLRFSRKSEKRQGNLTFIEHLLCANHFGCTYFHWVITPTNQYCYSSIINEKTETRKSWKGRKLKFVEQVNTNTRGTSYFYIHVLFPYASPCCSFKQTWAQSC